MEKNFAIEGATNSAERQLILEVMRLLGIMEDREFWIQGRVLGFGMHGL
jgi:hypothetical protein